MRSTKDFQSPTLLVILYKFFIPSVMEYGLVIWSPHQIGHINMINKVQVRFVRMLGKGMGYTYGNAPVTDLEAQYHTFSHFTRN